MAVQGAALAAAPAPLVVVLGTVAPNPWSVSIAGSAALCLVLAGLVVPRFPIPGRLLAMLGAAATIAGLSPRLVESPLLTLIVLAAFLWSGFAPADDFAVFARDQRRASDRRFLVRARSASAIALGTAAAALFLADAERVIVDIATLASVSIAAAFAFQWDRSAARTRPRRVGQIAILSLAFVLVAVPAFWLGAARIVGALAACGIYVSIPRMTRRHTLGRESWFNALLLHPARLLITTFAALCLVGTVLLMIPAATHEGTLDTIDACFTAVSAVCVTGLIVRDTPHDFTFLGQGIILILIQLGGLGIMSISTLALHALGRRMNLKHERVVATLHADSGSDLFRALRRVLLFTLGAEGVGLAALTLQFSWVGDPPGVAIWRGLFTAVSAFCNAGFALQSDSLLPYAHHPLVLHTVAALIILGGMAPAVTLSLAARRDGAAPSPVARLVLAMTAALLVIGMVSYLAMEWDRTLGHLSAVDKFHHAWFQSVTLRTAGFNSVDIQHVTAATMLFMVAFMFIGGSPGGTAGGVKTTTIAVLLAAVWSSVVGRREVLIFQRPVPATTVHRAIAVIVVAGFVATCGLFALVLTQDIPARDLIFEVASASGTVGLSTGATGMLDTIGKVVIILLMFLGRVGPLTLFMILTDDQKRDSITGPDLEIPIS